MCLETPYLLFPSRTIVPHINPAHLLERAALCRFPSVRAFQRGTGVQHTVFAAMRRGISPRLDTLAAYCRGVQVTLASVLAACWHLDVNDLAALHLRSDPGITTLLPRRNANTGSGKRRSFEYRVLHLGDWSLFPIFRPGDLLLIQPILERAGRAANRVESVRPLVVVQRSCRYFVGRLTKNSGGATLEPHPDSGHPSISLCNEHWKVVGTVRGYVSCFKPRQDCPRGQMPIRARGHSRAAAKSRFAAMARAARTRLGLSIDDMVEKIRDLAQHLPGERARYFLSRSRIGGLESSPRNSKLNIFGFFALLAVYGLDYREALDALGCGLNEEDYPSIHELLDIPSPEKVISFERHRCAEFIDLHPNWSRGEVTRCPHGIHPFVPRDCLALIERTPESGWFESAPDAGRIIGIASMLPLDASALFEHQLRVSA